MSKGSVEKERSVSTMRILVFSLAAIGVSACSSQKPWSVEEVTGHLPDLDFFPGGGKGAPVTAKIHEGKILLMYFGFLQTTGGVHRFNGAPGKKYGWLPSRIFTL